MLTLRDSSDFRRAVDRDNESDISDIDIDIIDESEDSYLDDPSEPSDEQIIKDQAKIMYKRLVEIKCLNRDVAKVEAERDELKRQLGVNIGFVQPSAAKR